jgi:hypothetical protein
VVVVVEDLVILVLLQGKYQHPPWSASPL